MSKFTLLLAAAVTFVLSGRPAGADDADLLTLATAGNRAARQAIRTLTATVHADSVTPRKMVLAQARYVRSGETAMIHEGGKRPGGKLWQLSDRGEVRTVNDGRTRAGHKLTRATRGSASGVTRFSDAWTELLLGHCDAEGRPTSYDDLFRSGTPGRARRTDVGGSSYVVVPLTLRGAGGERVIATFWHSVAHNYLVAKREMVSDTTPEVALAEITEWAEPEPGVHLPLKCVRSVTRDGVVLNRRETTLSEVAVNKPVPRSALTLPPIPTGTILADEVAGTTGPVDATWTPIGPRTQLVKIIAPPAPSPDRPSSQSASEPTPAGFWVAIGGGIVIAIGCVLLAYRALRRGS